MKIIIIKMMKDLNEKHLKNAFPKSMDIIFINWNDKELYKKLIGCNGIIISGSNCNVLDKNSPTLSKKILDLDIPILGVCYGFELLVQMTNSKNVLHTWNKIEKYSKFFEIPLLGLKRHRYYFYHDTYVQKLSNDWKIDLKLDDYIIMAHLGKKNIIGVQFHPEHYVGSAAPFYNNWLKNIINK